MYVLLSKLQKLDFGIYNSKKYQGFVMDMKSKLELRIQSKFIFHVMNERLAINRWLPL